LENGQVHIRSCWKVEFASQKNGEHTWGNTEKYVWQKKRKKKEVRAVPKEQKNEKEGKRLRTTDDELLGDRGVNVANISRGTKKKKVMTKERHRTGEKDSSKRA